MMITRESCRRVMALVALALMFATAAPLSAQTVRYIHTDALGSVVAVTDANRNVIERREYEPYGAQLKPAIIDGPGYTGHVQDAATGLTYMQQRYYDPVIGRFLSVDPVTPYEKPIANFNRYVYAWDNPYKFTDLDGREIRSINSANNQTIADHINSRAAGEFKFNGSNNLEKVGEGSGSGSQIYSDSLVQGISSDKTMLVAIQSTVGSVNVADHGNGLTGQVGDKIAVVINGQPLSTVDAAGAPLVDSPATILAHEIAGHAVPQMTGQPNANAVGIDNQIRSELGTPQIPADPTHKAYDPL